MSLHVGSRAHVHLAVDRGVQAIAPSMEGNTWMDPDAIPGSD